MNQKGGKQCMCENTVTYNHAVASVNQVRAEAMGMNVLDACRGTLKVYTSCVGR